jgi:hypothetical protein
MYLALTIGAAVLLGLAGLFLLLALVFRLVRRSLRHDLEQRLAPKDVLTADLFSNFFGQKSRGLAQIRGNGGLVLLRDRLYFLLAVPRRELVIPLENITDVSLPMSFLGKSVLRPLLRVDFSTAVGADAAAWALRDPGQWKTALEQAMHDHQHRSD